MNKKLITSALFLLSAIFIFLSQFNIKTQTPSNLIIEEAYNEIYNNEPYAFKNDYGINSTGSKIFKINANLLKIYTSKLILTNEIELPFDQKDIVKFINPTHENSLYIATVDYTHYSEIYSETALTPKSIYSIDFSTSEVSKLNAENYIILDIMSSIEQDKQIYLKYQFDNHLYYGYLDLFTGKFQSVVELNKDNYYDIYNNSDLLASVNILENRG